MKLSDRIINVMGAWIFTITAPIWIWPFFIYMTIRDKDFKKIYIQGERGLFE